VIGIGGGLIILAVAQTALQGQVDELHRALLRVAIVAAHVLMPAEQRKARFLMHETYFGNVLPALKGMAAFTVRPECAVVHVFMAGLAIAGGAGEFQRGMAPFALDRRVLAGQRKPGLFVFEFDLKPQRRPAFGGVTITAGNLNFSVGIFRRSGLRIQWMVWPGEGE